MPAGPVELVLPDQVPLGRLVVAAGREQGDGEPRDDQRDAGASGVVGLGAFGPLSFRAAAVRKWRRSASAVCRTRVAAPIATVRGPELAGHDLGRGDGADQRAAGDRPAQRASSRSPEPGQAAADDDQRGVHEVQQAGHGDAQVLGGLVAPRCSASGSPASAASSMAVMVELAAGQRAVRVLVQERGGPRDQGAGADPRRQAAAQAADAGLALRDRWPGGRSRRRRRWRRGRSRLRMMRPEPTPVATLM